MRRKILGAALALGLILASPAETHATPVVVGSGASISMVLIEFNDGNVFEFAVSYDGSATGEDLLRMMEAETTFDFEGVFFDFGQGPKLFVYAMRFGGSLDGALGNFATSPVYYVKPQANAPWVVSGLGATDRIVSDGTFDGWTFSEVTIPEPSALALLAIGGMMLAWRRRNTT